MCTKDWQWNEMQQVGTDYTDIAQVEIYDERMGTFRDIVGENREMLEMLTLAPGSSVLEIGAGTGRFAITAAQAGMTVTAIDVSSVMLEYINHKAAVEGLHALATQHAGFLTLDFPEASFDAVVSCAALHHLPDLWKQVALHNINRALKPGGQFILRDVVFMPTDDKTPEMCFERFADSIPNMRIPAARHIAQEFSTYDWIMEGLLLRAGFEVLSKSNPSESFFMYHCRKK